MENSNNCRNGWKKQLAAERGEEEITKILTTPTKIIKKQVLSFRL